ncbi:MAG: hypothetical protein QNL33_20135 [Akkermansiaceae bacterium]
MSNLSGFGPEGILRIKSEKNEAMEHLRRQKSVNFPTAEKPIHAMKKLAALGTGSIEPFSGD